MRVNERGQLVPETIEEIEAIREADHRNRIYLILNVYLIVICLGTVVLIALLVLTAFGVTALPTAVPVLSGLGFGTGGLAFGVVAFRGPISRLFPKADS
jgi:hypothetical protein